jgi:hypothetical protein
MGTGLPGQTSCRYSFLVATNSVGIAAVGMAAERLAGWILRKTIEWRMVIAIASAATMPSVILMSKPECIDVPCPRGG